MSSKDYILNKIKENTKEVFEKPNLKDIPVTEFNDPVAQFKESLTAVGGEYYEVNGGETLNMEEIIKRFFPDAKTIASTLNEMTFANLNPDTVDKPQDLDGIDVAILKSDLGVAENAAVWFEQDMKHRILYFIPEALVILLDKEQIVPTMHHAYAKIDKREIPDFGVFISGPSKTADIEQALVMGAHGARRVLVILK
ncbi:MAG: LUD domain-containing protein [Bacteroidales bacterium]|nr:LUD domain-containing protein [Bacteroidales bacterium]